MATNEHSHVVMKRLLITLDTPLGQIPLNWLRYIEPRISRDGWDGCWIWTGKTDRDNGYPIINDPATHVQTGARRYVAKMFWDFPDDFFVGCDCRYRNCLRPDHFIISDRNPRWHTPSI